MSITTDSDIFTPIPPLQEETNHPKRKRSNRPRAPTEEEHLALCLLMLARGEHGLFQSDATAPKPTYTCKVCKKTFSSYQGLGGHKASHRNSESASSQSVSVPAPVTSKTTDGRTHRCGICHRTFGSGQALGGHKRCHYDGTIGSGAGSGNSSSTSVGSSSANRGFGIDLNLPVMTEFGLRWNGGDDVEEVQSPVTFKRPRFLVQA